MNFDWSSITKCKLKIHPLLIPMFFLFWQYGSLKIILYMLCFVTVHEVSHCVVALFFGGKIKEFWITPIGERAIIQQFDAFSYTKRQMILLAGPFSNLLCACVCLLLDQTTLVAINFAIGIFNLLPFLPLDGGRILLNLWGKRSGTLKAASILTRISRGFGYCLIAIGILQAILYPFTFSLLLIGCYMVSINRREYLHITYGLYKQLMKKNKNTLPIRACYTNENAILGDLTEVMNPDYYFMFYRRHNGVMEQKTQQEIMSLLMERGTIGKVWE